MKSVFVALFAALVAVQAGVAQTGGQAPVTPPGGAAAAADPAPRGEDPAAELKKVVDALKRLKITGYVQAQYVDDESSRDELSGSGTRNRDQFSIRRGRVKFVYAAAPTARVTLQIDAASGGVTLRDAYVELIAPWTAGKHTLTAGQFIWPFGFELQYSSSTRELPERSRVVRALFPGDRDRGLMLSGAGFENRLSYKIALVNGTGTSQSFDFNSDKDLVGRLGWTAGPLEVGASGYVGKELAVMTGAPLGAEFDKTRYGFDLNYKTPLPGLGLRGELIVGEEKGVDVSGWYAYAIQNVGKRHQFAVRVDEYDPSSDSGNNSTLTLGGAYTFHWDPNTKLVFGYEHPELEEDDPSDDVATVRVQYKF